MIAHTHTHTHSGALSDANLQLPSLSSFSFIPVSVNASRDAVCLTAIGRTAGALWCCLINLQNKPALEKHVHGRSSECRCNLRRQISCLSGGNNFYLPPSAKLGARGRGGARRGAGPGEGRKRGKCPPKFKRAGRFGPELGHRKCEKKRLKSAPVGVVAGLLTIRKR